MRNPEQNWRSLNDLQGTADSPIQDAGPAKWSRRRFLALMGASAALAGLSSCRWPEEMAAPFAHRPIGTEPGQTKSFATSMELAGSAQPLLITCIDGRPIKIEGNPSHPASRGASGIHAQASLLELYDPDRGRQPMMGRAPATWQEFDVALRTAVAESAKKYGENFVIISERTTSPATERIRNQVRRRFPRARWIEWEPVTRDTQRSALHDFHGKRARELFDLGNAEVVVTLEEDLFALHPDALRHARDWADARSPGAETPPRLYAIESAYSLTGAMADNRLPARQSEILAAAVYLYAAVAKHQGKSASVQDLDIMIENPLASFLDVVAEDLIAAGEKALLTTGPAIPREVHLVIAETNRLLGNLGTTRRLIEEPGPEPMSSEQAIEKLKAFRVESPADCVLILGGNPAYDAPADLDVAEAILAAKSSFHLSLYQNETSQLCDWYAPRAHYLESWGEATNWDGSRTPIQPGIAPLYDGRTEVELLANMLGLEKTKEHDILRESWNDEDKWNDFLRLGIHSGEIVELSEAEQPPPIGDAIERLAQTGPDGIDVLFRADYRIYDGRFANNPWQQELPDPLTNITWDNAALVDPSTAEQRRLTTGDIVEISTGNLAMTLPVYVMPGQAEGTIVLPLGYGRKMGRAGEGTGSNVYPMRKSDTPWRISNARMKRAGGHHEFACTSDHFQIDSLGRKESERRAGTLVRETTFAQFARHPEEVAKPHHTFPKADLWKGPLLSDGHQWAMTMDLNRCNGCSACVVACQGENNIPVVGPDQVRRGREMHWLRIDRLYRGSVENPKVRHQPMTCLHCENAPCEQVCPVAATVHSREGLNEMVYNRCIGTRYCSNNCPVKVRRFNYYNYYGKMDDIEKMRMNPDVSVRNRGVMEKCSLCVQRIAKARVEAKIEGHPLNGDDILPACAQACPTRAIQFGDLSDSDGQFAKTWNGPRAYEILEELKLGARIRYLARLTNTHPDLGEAVSTHEPDHV